MGIDLKTVGFELFNFVVLLWLLRRFLFTPVRDLIARRREEIERGATELNARRAEAEALRARYEGMVEVFEADEEGRRQRARRSAQEEAEVIVARARTDAERLKVELARDLDDMRRRVLDQVRGRVGALARDAAGVILREVGGESLDEAYARQAAHRLLGEAARVRPGARIKLELCSDADRDRLAAEVARVIGADHEVDVSVDDELIAGVRITVGDVEVEASVAATLGEWTGPEGPGQAAVAGGV